MQFNQKWGILPLTHRNTWRLAAMRIVPRPPRAIPPPGGGRPSLQCCARQYLLRWFVFPICHTHVLAMLSHYFKLVTCVYSVIFSPKAVCRVSCPFFRPKMFPPGDRVCYYSRTLRDRHSTWDWGILTLYCIILCYPAPPLKSPPVARRSAPPWGGRRSPSDGVPPFGGGGLQGYFKAPQQWQIHVCAQCSLIHLQEKPA